MDLIKVLSNSAKLEILQFIQIHGPSTTRQIAAGIPGIPSTTLYRHINALLKDEALIVTKEKRVRGSVERTLGIQEENFKADADNLAGVSFQFLMWLHTKFYHYSLKEDADPARDRLSLRTGILKLNDDRFDQLSREIWELIKDYEETPDADGKPRSISVISAPAEVPD